MRALIPAQDFQIYLQARYRRIQQEPYALEVLPLPRNPEKLMRLV
jgi:hypothetical protein